MPGEVRPAEEHRCDGQARRLPAPGRARVGGRVRPDARGGRPRGRPARRGGLQLRPLDPLARRLAHPDLGRPRLLRLLALPGLRDALPHDPAAPPGHALLPPGGRPPEPHLRDGRRGHGRPRADAAAPAPLRAHPLRRRGGGPRGPPGGPAEGPGHRRGGAPRELLRPPGPAARRAAAARRVQGRPAAELPARGRALRLAARARGPAARAHLRGEDPRAAAHGRPRRAAAAHGGGRQGHGRAAGAGGRGLG
mmetsp:Transcript_44335/g.141266  ORF Transcript_44335/g.141266 Transcript_44335/m.141266 type:complete len:251 (-) Transcript_44335:29-781(-)